MGWRFLRRAPSGGRHGWLDRCSRRPDGGGHRPRGRPRGV